MPGQHRWSIGGVLILLAVLGVLLVAFGWLLGPFDLLTFLRAGQRILDGNNPYVSVSSGVFQAGHAFVYPTFVAWALAPLALLPQGLAEVLYIGGSAGAIVLACSLLGRTGVFPAALVLLSSTTIVGLQMGTVNAYLFLGLACAWRYRTSRPVVSGIVLGLVAAVKLFLFPILAWPLLARRYSTAAAGAMTFVLLFGASAIFGPVGIVSYLHLLSKLQGNEASQSWSLTSLFESIGLGSFAAQAVSILIAAGILVALRIRSTRLSEGQLMGMVVVCCLLVSPIVWSSYLLLLAVPVLLATADNRALAITALASWAVVTPDVSTPARTAVGIGLTVVVGYLAVRAELPGDRRRPSPTRPYANRRTGTLQTRALAAAVTAVAVVGLIAVPQRSATPCRLCCGWASWRSRDCARGWRWRPPGVSWSKPEACPDGRTAYGGLQPNALQGDAEVVDHQVDVQPGTRSLRSSPESRLRSRGLRARDGQDDR